MKTKTNRYTARVRKKFGMGDASFAYETLLRPYREPGDPLQLIASKLGVSSIVEEPLPVDGAVAVDGQGRLVIKINSTCSLERRRFTVGHEIGHLILQEALRGPVSCQGDLELEAACDAIAAELVMPLKDTVSFVEGLGSASPENLKVIAETFSVSLRVAAWRVHGDLKLWRRSIGLWHLDGRVRQKWFVGRRPWAQGTPVFAAFERALESSEAVRTRESVWEDNSVKPVSLEVLHLGNRNLLGMVA